MGPAMVRSGSILEATGYGFLAVYDQISALVSLPAEMIRGQISPDQGRFVGLKGIYDLFGQAVSRDIQSRQTTQTTAPPSASSPNPSKPVNPQSPTYFTFQLIAMLAVSIGFINLFPFPALDGGRIFFVLLELITRRRVRPEIENYVHAAGFAILIVFMIYVNAMDFIHPAVINLPK
jgi:membrane-associated protease RseP (regulator of RpoE activity)